MLSPSSLGVIGNRKVSSKLGSMVLLRACDFCTTTDGFFRLPGLSGDGVSLRQPRLSWSSETSVDRTDSRTNGSGMASSANKPWHELVSPFYQDGLLTLVLAAVVGELLLRMNLAAYLSTDSALLCILHRCVLLPSIK